MSMDLDRLLMETSERAACGCPVVNGGYESYTAHFTTCDELDTPSIPEPVRTARGYVCTKGADEGLVIVGEAGAYGGTIRDLCFDLESGSYMGETLVTGVWHASDLAKGDLVRCKLDVGWPRAGVRRDWLPNDMGTVIVGVYREAPEGYKGLTFGRNMIVLCAARFEIDGRA